jgi:hypothetical protein
METFQVVKGFVDGHPKWSVVRIKHDFQSVVICGTPHDTFRAAAAELTRLYRKEHPEGTMSAAPRRQLNGLG